ncbi:MAG: SDR family oxidoreductase [Flavobacteriaceae bacterium]|nr:SDR family oxidoreductase [Flavobacteriaceae bacterium]MCY4268483.1 SDR family oxidoreductase [Flavobacteriaceae bacterium]
MDLGIKDKVAFIGGSSQGIGKSIALQLAKEGVIPILSGRKVEPLNQARAEIENKTRITPMTIQGDLSINEDRLHIIQTALDAFDTIDILITNTGGPPAGNFDDFEQTQWNKAYELLFGSAVSIIRGFLPKMKSQQWGRIIAITSVSSKQPIDNLILSNAIRSSVVGLIKSLANELGPYQITANNVMPGYTATQRLKALTESNPNFANVLSEIPMKRFGKPEELAATVTFLASQQASYINGVSLAVDGGWIKSSI